jgi:hypothetical protein
VAAEDVLRTPASGRVRDTSIWMEEYSVEAEFFPVTVRGLIATAGFVRAFPQFKLVVNFGRAPVPILVWQMKVETMGPCGWDSSSYQPLQ